MPVRRRHFRRAFDSLEYFAASANNGGFLLNLSEAGFSTQLSRSADELGIFQFTMYLNQESPIGAAGQVAWRNPAGTVVGIHFLELSYDARQAILKHVRRVMSGAEGRRFASHAALDKPVAELETLQREAREPYAKLRTIGPRPIAHTARPSTGRLPTSLLSPPYFGLDETSPQEQFISFPAAEIFPAPPRALKQPEEAPEGVRKEGTHPLGPNRS